MAGAETSCSGQETTPSNARSTADPTPRRSASSLSIYIIQYARNEDTLLIKNSTKLFLLLGVTIEDSADGGVCLKQLEVSVEGLVQQYVECYTGYDTQLEALWEQDRQFWC